MPLFGPSPEELEAARDVARPMTNWVWSVPPADLATELMAAFGPDGPGRDGKTIYRYDLFKWLFRGYANLTDDTIKGQAIRIDAEVQVRGPILEAMQLLEHAELICVAWWGEGSPQPEWHATRSGLATLAEGKDVVRQRIRDRTGAVSGMGRSTVTPPPRSIPQRLQELDTLRATGVISGAEYTAKREQIINEI